MIIRIYLFIFIAFMGMLSFTSFLLTRAYFTDTASASLSLSTANEFNTEPLEPSPTDTPSASPSVSPTISITPTVLEKIVINEVFESSSNSAEWIELYNFGTESIDISGWTVNDFNSTDIFPQSIPLIEPGKHVIVVPNSTIINEFPEGIQIVVLSGSSGNLIGNGLAKGGDTLVLKNGIEIIDQISWGTNTSILNPSIPEFNTGSSINRIPNGIDTDTASDWSLGSPSMGFANN